MPVLLSYDNAIDAATLSGGAWAGAALNNLKDTNVQKWARSTNALKTSTVFKCAFASSKIMRAFALANHNLSSAALWRLRAGMAPLDVDFTSGAQTDDRITYSGGANGTRVNSAGTIVSATTPRLDYAPVALTSSGLLMEEQRTNIGLRSAELGDAAWTKGSATVTADAWTAPDGTATGDDLVAAAATAAHFVAQTVTVTANTTYCAAFFVRARTGIATHVQVFYDNGASVGGMINVRLSDGAVTRAASALTTGTNVNGGVVPFTGGLYLVWIAAQHTGTSGRYGVVMLDTANAAAAALGPSIAMTTGDSIGVWGGMLQQGAFPTAYIGTAGATVTRTADVVSITGGSFSGSHSATAGTLYAEFDCPASGTRPILSLDDNTANEQIRLYVSGTSLKMTVTDGGVTQADITIGTVAAGTFYKVAIAWAANDFAACLSGGTVQTDTSGTLPTVDRMRLGADQAGNYLCGHLKRVTRWTTRRSNADLQAISTSGPGAIGYDSGWLSALRMSFYGETPSDWGAAYNVLQAFSAVTAQYATVEIDDTANTDGWVQIGRAFFGSTSFQPSVNAAYGLEDRLLDLSSKTVAAGGTQFSVRQPVQREVGFGYDSLTQAEADQAHELMSSMGTTDEVVYIPDDADMALSQRYGHLGLLQTLDPLAYPNYALRTTKFSIRQKL